MYSIFWYMNLVAMSSPQPLSVLATEVRLPMCDWTVPAGFPSPAADHTRKSLDLNEHLIRNKEATFLFRVKGDSMISAGIHNGDLAVVERRKNANVGEQVVAVVDDQFTLKTGDHINRPSCSYPMTRHHQHFPLQHGSGFAKPFASVEFLQNGMQQGVLV